MSKSAFRSEIKRRMYIMGYDRSSLARAAGIPLCTIDKVLMCKVIPRCETASAIADALKMDAAEFRAMLYDAQRSA